MNKFRLDQELFARGLVNSRSQAESYIKLGHVQVNGKTVKKAGQPVSRADLLELKIKDQYVSRAALKLDSVAGRFKLDFKNKTVLDVGSSTGGFTDYALKHGAKKVVAVEVGKDQLHESLRGDKRIELHEKTDIRGFSTDDQIDVVLADVSFVSLRQILPTMKQLASPSTIIIAMVKPQFESSETRLKNRGVIKNESIRRQILADFENWVQKLFKIVDKADSQVTGEKGNRERFYMLKQL